MSFVFLKARRAIQLLAGLINQLKEENSHLSQVVNANKNEFEQIINAKDREFQQRETEVRNHVCSIEKMLQSQGNELANEKSWSAKLARQVDQVEQTLFARNRELEQQTREGEQSACKI